MSEPVSSAPTSASSGSGAGKAAGLAFLFELVQVAAMALAIIIPVRYFLVQPFYVKGASMEPNFQDHEYLIIDELSYRFDEPKRGDVVVFRYDVEGGGPESRQYLIKRVIGVPGETVRVSNGTVRITNAEHPEGYILQEPYLDPLNAYTSTNREASLGPGEYFVLGDNRLVSRDSRVFGAVRREQIVGKVWVRGWPTSRWTVFDPVSYPHPSVSTTAL